MTDPRYRVVKMTGVYAGEFGAKCSVCGRWLTKWDFTEADAAACAVDALERGEHECPEPKRAPPDDAQLTL